jgi:uncharacterized protein (DUF2235 family)
MPSNEATTGTAETSAKSLIVCFDGTWNRPSIWGWETNVRKLHDALLPTDGNGELQEKRYRRGVGTGGLLDRFLGGAFGIGLSASLRYGYGFLVDNFSPGDRIFLFGFSRGAYTARSLGGMIGAAGLLEPQHAHRIADAFEYYRTPKEARPLLPGHALFTDETRRPQVTMIGVWDTVGALGIPLWGLRSVFSQYFSFHDTSLGAHVDHAYHALALDEHRDPFLPTLWTPNPANTHSVIEQTWFAGSHSDVGGGYRDRQLATISLLWMIDKARKHGLAFDTAYLAKLKQSPSAGAIHDSRSSFYRRVYLPRHRWVGRQYPASEKIHASVRQRIAASEHSKSPYAPSSLVDGYAAALPIDESGSFTDT